MAIADREDTVLYAGVVFIIIV